MVSASIHYVIGVLIARYFGHCKNKKYKLGIWAVVPDFDFLFILLSFIVMKWFNNSLNWLWYSPTGIYLFSHRAFSHSFLFIAIVGVILWFIKINPKIRAVSVLIMLSHFLLDWMTPWKSFFLAPFSYKAFHLGVVDIFDPVLIVLSSLVFSFLISEDLIRTDHKISFKKFPVIFAYLFYLLIGLLPSIVTGEFNLIAVILSNILVLLVVAYFWFSKIHVKELFNLFHRGVKWSCYAIGVYIIIIILLQGYYSILLGGISLSQIEPVSTYKFSNFYHTYEIPGNNSYNVGIIGLKGVLLNKTIPKYKFHTTATINILDEIKYIEDAYDNKLLNINWVNNPVWNIYTDNNKTTYVQVSYAKGAVINDQLSEYNGEQGIKLYYDKQEKLVKVYRGIFD